MENNKWNRAPPLYLKTEYIDVDTGEITHKEELGGKIYKIENKKIIRKHDKENNRETIRTYVEYRVLVEQRKLF